MDTKPGASAPMNPTERMIAQLGRVQPTPEQAAHVELVRGAYVALAETLARVVPASAEFTVALRKLVESKDCAVRAVLFP